jgi:pimeloyl-ACP methyl ester carboxylesterase
MATFILVHGAWHGVWCWKYIIPILEDKGHKVLLPNLPELDSNCNEIKNISLKLYVETVVNLINSQNDNVILLGHSFGGVIISEVAEALPNKVQSLVYLCAFMLKDNQKLMDIVKDAPSPYLKLDFLEDFSFCRVKEEAVALAFYNKCKKEDIDFATPLLLKHPYATFNIPVRITEQKYGTILCYYIECVNDNAISIDAQRKMWHLQQIDKVYTMDTDHSPFFSAPEKLVKILDEIAKISI